MKFMHDQRTLLEDIYVHLYLFVFTQQKCHAARMSMHEGEGLKEQQKFMEMFPQKEEVRKKHEV